MNEKYEALALSQLLVMHADNIQNPDVQNMVINAATELSVLHAENERLREALTYDWDQLEACRESLREHMVEIKRLREVLELNDE